MMRHFRLITAQLKRALTALFLLLFLQLPAQSIDTTTAGQAVLPSIFETFFNDSIQHLRIKGDFTKLINEKFSGQYEKAKLELLVAGESIQSYKIKMRARGKSRRRLCAFPPIKLKFSKKELEAQGLAPSMNDLKLVCPCSDRKGSGQDILKEYLAYKLYNEVTEASFEVQLVKMDFVDIGSDNQWPTRYGFLIESVDELGGRLLAEEQDTYNLNCRDMKVEEYYKMVLFQYMIGNTDWRIPFLHNIKVFKAAKGPFLAVPFDFDFAGMVDAPYAKPNPDCPITNVRERHFMGSYEHSPEAWQATVAQFRELKPQFTDIIIQNIHLTNKEKKRVIRYLKSFYNIIATDKLAYNKLKSKEW
ncbi:MAG: hypothetical protein AAGG75_15575 [Bacteroidota bacterium]